MALFSADFKMEFRLQLRILGRKIIWCKSLKVEPYELPPPEAANIPVWQYNLQKAGMFDPTPYNPVRDPNAVPDLTPTGMF